MQLRLSDLIPALKRQSETDSPSTVRRSLPLRQMVYVLGGIGAAIALVWMVRPTPIAVDIGTVERGSLQVTVNAEGKTRVRDRYTVAAAVNGHLVRILLHEGDAVQQGTLVARIDPLPLTASVQQSLGQLAEWRAQREGVATQRPKLAAIAQVRSRIQAANATLQESEAKVAAAEASLEQARRDRQRAENLERTGAIARQDRELAELTETNRQKELEAAKMAANAARSQVRVEESALAVVQQERSDPDYLLKVYDAKIASTEAELRRLTQDAARTEMRSPVPGKILKVLQKSAQFVTEGTPLLEIGDPTRLELVIDVLSTDAQKIAPGDPMLLEQGPDTAPMRAQVRRIEPAAFTKVSALGVEEQRVNVIGDFVDASPSFGDAYRVDARLVIWERPSVLKLPLSALFRCDKTAWCTFLIIDNHARRQRVEIGRRNDLAAEILQGLQPGDRVILHPSEQIQDGTLVQGRSP